MSQKPIHAETEVLTFQPKTLCSSSIVGPLLLKSVLNQFSMTSFIVLLVFSCTCQKLYLSYDVLIFSIVCRFLGWMGDC